MPHVVNLGEGKVAISGGLQMPNRDTVIGMLFLQLDKGAGEVGADVPELPAGKPIWPDKVNGTILEFSNIASVDVVIERLQDMRATWTNIESDPVLRAELFEEAN